MILLKINDNIHDSNKIIYRLLYKILSRKKQYKILKEKYKQLVEKLNSLYNELYYAENKSNNDFDVCSKPMGEVLFEIVNTYLKTIESDCKNEILSFATHLGMWIYLIDAYDDFEKDVKKNSFNPLYSFAMGHENKNYGEVCINSGQMMLGMMNANLLRILDKITLYRHKEIIFNVIKYGTRRNIQLINTRRRKNNDKYSNGRCSNHQRKNQIAHR